MSSKQEERVPVIREMGTSEIARRFTVVPKLSNPNTYSAKVMDETAIDRLLLDDTISPAEHSSLEKFMVKLHKMGFVGVKSPDYSSPIHADATAVGDKRAQTIRGMVKIIRALDKEIGPSMRKALVNLLLLDTPWPYGKDDIRTCASALMRILA